VNLRIRPAIAADLPAMAAVKHAAGLAAWPHILPRDVLESLALPERWAAAITSSDPRTEVLVAKSGRRVIGFAITRPSGDEDASDSTGELDGFYVEPASWGVGAGRSLLAAATSRLRDAGFIDATLWTAEQNHRPRRIYEIAGWWTDGADRHRELGGVGFVEVRYRLKIPRPTSS
jgi:ribosomal protein S18 acetylase RimI-like enzyme